MGIYRLHGFFGLFPSVLPFLFIIFCPFPFPVLFLSFVCVLFVPVFFFVCPCFLVCSFSCSLIVCFLLFCFILFCPFPFIFSFLFAVCYIFPFPFLPRFFPFVLFPFSFSLSFHVIFLLSSSRPFYFWMFLVFFPFWIILGKLTTSFYTHVLLYLCTPYSIICFFFYITCDVGKYMANYRATHIKVIHSYNTYHIFHILLLHLDVHVIF